MLPKPLPSIDIVRSALSYDPETGLLTWRWRDGFFQSWNVRRAGEIAGHLDKTTGYIVINIDGELYKAHRLAWLLHYGEEPPTQIDHEDRNRSNNKIGNLRPAPGSRNQQNRCRRKKSGLPKGVYRISSAGSNAPHPFAAEIKTPQERLYLGSFSTPEAAHEAYVVAAKKHFGEFANAG